MWSFCSESELMEIAASPTPGTYSMLNCPGRKPYILRISSSMNWQVNVFVLEFSVRTSRMRAGTGIQVFIPQMGSGRAAVSVSVILNLSFTNRRTA